MEQGLKIGLALSGGGARGAAHVGVIRALLEHDIVPTHVSAVSAGAIIGALYAAGRTPDEMMDFAIKSSLVRLYKVGMPITGLTKLDYLKERLATLIPENSFAGLLLPLHVGITNLNTGAQELRSSGPLHDIVAASCSIPFVFKPVELDGSQYVDGGVVKNMPVEPLINDADYIIGSNLMPYANLPATNVHSVIGIVWRCFDLGIMANTLPSMNLCDIVMEPPRLNDYNIFNLTKMREMHDVGYEETVRRVREIRNGIELKQELLSAMRE